MRFYLNDIEVFPIVAPTMEEVKDKRLDSCNLTLGFTSKRECYKPMLPLLITDDLNNEYNFVIVSDQVENVKKGATQYYQHTLTFTHRARALSKLPVRNSVFSNYYNEKNVAFNSSYAIITSGEQTLTNNYNEQLYIKNDGDFIVNIEISIDYTDYASTSTIAYSKNGKTLTATIPNIVLTGPTTITIPIAKKTNDSMTIQKTITLAKGYYLISVPKATFNSSSTTIAASVRTRVSVISGKSGNSLYNTLDILRKQIALSDDEFTNPSPFILPYTESDDFYQTLKNTESPEFTFTQMNAFQCVANILYFLDGEPTLNKKNKLGIEYYNDKNKTNITFDNTTNYSSAIAEEKYCNGLLVDINKGHIQNTITIPNKYSSLAIRYLDYGLQSDNDNFGIPLPYGIDYLTRVYVILNGSFTEVGSSSNISFTNTKIDITKAIVSDIEYYNDKNKTKISLDNTTNYSSSIAEEKYCNGLMADINKGHIQNTITIPNKYSGLAIRYLDYGIQEDNDNYGIPLPYGIDYLTRVYVILNGSFTEVGSSSNISFTNTKIDITKEIVSDIEYLLLDKSVNPDMHPNTALTQQSAFHFSKGDKFLKFGGSFQFQITMSSQDILTFVVGKAIARTFGYTSNQAQNYFPRPYVNVSNTTEVSFQIEYVPIVQTKLLIQGNENKYSGYERLDQTSGDVSMARLGSNLFGQVSMLGNESRYLTKAFSSFENRIKKGTIWKDNNEEWVANDVQNTINGRFTIQNIQFTKNFNSLSNFIQLNQNKRFSNIDDSIVQRSEDVYCEYFYFSLENNLTKENIHFDANIIEYSILMMLRNLTFTNFPTYSVFRNGNTDISMDFVKFGSGNTLCFVMSFEDTMSAGKYNDNNTRKPIIYTDADGSKDLVSFTFYSVQPTYTQDLNPNYPLIVNTTNFNELGHFTNLQFYKKPNEIFALNYEIIFLSAPDQEIYFGEQFIINNLMVGNRPNLPCKIFYSTNEKYSILDKKALGSEYINNGYWIKNNNNQFSCVSDIETQLPISLPALSVSWCICDENENILIAFNVKDPTKTNSAIFYTATRHTRL